MTTLARWRKERLNKGSDKIEMTYATTDEETRRIVARLDELCSGTSENLWLLSQRGVNIKGFLHSGGKITGMVIGAVCQEDAERVTFFVVLRSVAAFYNDFRGKMS